MHLANRLLSRIYDYAFGTKSLHVVPQHELIIHYRNNFEEWIPPLEYNGVYNIRVTCRQIAKETEHYVFQTLEFSRGDSIMYGPGGGFLPLAPEYAEFKAMLNGRWKHVRHLMIQYFHMDPMVLQCKQHLPRFPLPGVTRDSYGFKEEDQIFWPADGRNLTTLTIHDMRKRPAYERESLLRVMRFYFPKLEDLRCSYYGDLGCMRRYRIAGNELKWWYTGEVFKQLPEEPTQEEWFGWY